MFSYNRSVNRLKHLIGIKPGLYAKLDRIVRSNRLVRFTNKQHFFENANVPFVAILRSDGMYVRALEDDETELPIAVHDDDSCELSCSSENHALAVSIYDVLEKYDTDTLDSASTTIPLTELDAFFQV